VLRISEYIRELFPPGVFNVVTGEHDLWIGMIPHSGVDLICFTKSANREEPTRMKTQVLVWSLARKASYHFADLPLARPRDHLEHALVV
jgi:hypothetical protein